MKVTTKTQTIVTNIALTKEEIRTLLSAQEICNKIWSKLEEMDTLNSTVEKIYDNLNRVDTNLEDIVRLVGIED